MKRILLILVGVILLGVGCSNQKDLTIQKQQEQIDQLISTIQEQASSTKYLQQEVKDLKNKPVPKPVIQPENPTLKIERCKATAAVQKGNIDKYIKNCTDFIDYEKQLSKFKILTESDWTEAWNKCVQSDIDKFQEQFYSECLSN